MDRSCCSRPLKAEAEAAEIGNVAALSPVRFSRFAIAALALLLVTAGLTSAASSRQATTAAPPATLVVPEVRGQAYVFAKGILEDSGFAWRVRGGVSGFAANLVATQFPAPGTRLLDTGAPVITLRLNRNPKYAEEGIPENFSPFVGTRLLRPTAAKPPAAKPPATRPKARSKPAPKPAAKPAAKPAPKATPKPTPKPAPKPAVKRPRAVTEKPAAKRPKATGNARPKVKKKAARPVAFTVPGAPKEPLNEMPLPRRARALGAWAAKHPRPTDANVAHWLYQHAWIVTGAKFGWWRGAEALRVLIAVDERVISNWGIGARSRAVARTALAEVEAKSS
jgi:PASTA domain